MLSHGHNVYKMKSLYYSLPVTVRLNSRLSKSKLIPSISVILIATRPPTTRFVKSSPLPADTDTFNEASFPGSSMNNLYVMKPVITTPKLEFKISEEECVQGFINSSDPVLFTIPMGLEIDSLSR